MLTSVIPEAAKEIIKAKLQLVSRLVWDRARFENWMQLEILDTLQNQLGNLQIEVAYPGTKERCDFAVTQDSKQAWLELKLCVTNYCSSFSDGHKTRPITTQVHDIIRDVAKLRRISAVAERSLLVIAYPLPLDYRVHPSWQSHLEKISQSEVRLNEAFSVELHRNKTSCMLVAYLIFVD